MKIQTKMPRPKKGEPLPKLRERVGTITLRAESAEEEALLAETFRVLFRMGAAGLDMGIAHVAEEIRRFDAAHSSKEAPDA